MTSPASLLDRINREIAALNLQGQPRELYEPVSYVLSLGGKRMRPLMLLMSCELFDGKIEQAINPAIGIEVFHNFTLLHDDIMDNAPLRRSQPTVHTRWNSNIAILSGDVMFVKACQLMMKTDERRLSEMLHLYFKTAREVCEGQQLDMNFETADQVTIADYMRMIELKTAVLLAAAMKIGAMIAHAPEEDAGRLYDFGRLIGIAFQLKDDLLDVYAGNGKFGKQVGGDIISNKKTFLLLKALELAKGETKDNLEKWLGMKSFVPEKKVQAVREIYDQLGVKQIMDTEIKAYFNKATERLTTVNLPEEKKAHLRSFVEMLMAREL